MEVVYCLFRQYRGYDAITLEGVFDHENYEYFIQTELLQE